MLLYLKQFALQAGHPLDLRRIGKDDWIEASKAAHGARFEPMGACIQAALLANWDDCR